MSAWTEVFALRVPCEAIGIEGDAWDFCDAHEEEPAFDRGEVPGSRFPYFAPSPTLGAYLDLVLRERVTGKRNSFGRCRAMTPQEEKQYLPLFRQYFPSLEAERIHHVHYCFYDGCEAPDYYAIEEDE